MPARRQRSEGRLIRGSSETASLARAALVMLRHYATLRSQSRKWFTGPSVRTPERGAGACAQEVKVARGFPECRGLAREQLEDLPGPTDGTQHMPRPALNRTQRRG
jgi:hypothetical protein